MTVSNTKPKRTILAAGRGFNPIMIKYFKTLCVGDKPKICLLPTASGDHPTWQKNWRELGEEAGFEAHVQPMFISSFEQDKDFREVLLSMDGIYVGGGNTINMLAIWQAHGIIDILKEAWNMGIVLGGGSAGGICWFESGLTDSRPKELTAMPAMGWLEGSYAPHYLSEPGRRAYFHKYMLSGDLGDGVACDDTSAVLYEDLVCTKAVGSTPDAKVFRVARVDGAIRETEMAVEYIG